MTLLRSRWTAPFAATCLLLISFMLSVRVSETFITPPDAAQSMGATTTWYGIAAAEAKASTPAAEAQAPTPATGVQRARKAMLPDGKLLSVWGDSRDGGKRRHQGEDVAAPSGTPIYAPLDLVIYKNSWGDRGGWTINGRDALGRRWFFAHFVERSPLQVGDSVKAGEVIGKVGNTGNAVNTPAHLHYQVSLPNGEWANPEEVLRDFP